MKFLKLFVVFLAPFFRLNRFQLILYRYVLYRLSDLIMRRSTSETFFLCASVFERNFIFF